MEIIRAKVQRVFHLRHLCVSIIKQIIFILVLFTSFAFIDQAYCIVYIDKDRPGGDGSSWENAYNTIQAAISGKDTNEEFWVAEGTYAPSSTLTPKSGSQFYGGFAGNETDRNQRNVTDHPTIISGSSTRRIFLIEQTGIRIDGFTMINGKAVTSGNDWTGLGGAILIDRVPSEIANCTFTNNSATIMGGAICVNQESQTTTIDNCIFQSNSSVTFGGAIAGHESDLTITNSSFTSNSVSGGSNPYGGAIYISLNTNPVVTNCTFTGNTSSHSGGAVMLNNPTSASVTGCEFYNNSAEAGGALSGQWDASSSKPSVTIEECLFQGNVSSLEGGAIYSFYCHMDIQNSRFQGNTAVNGGAILLDYKLSGPSTINRCLFTGNSASIISGAIRSYARSIEVENSVFIYNSAPNGGAVGLHAGLNEHYDSGYSATFKNCTFSENSANGTGGNGWGGAILGTLVPTTLLYNCIFWENHANAQVWNNPPPEYQETSDVFFTDATTDLTIRYTNMETLTNQHGTVNIVDDTGSFSLDPLFIDPDGEDNTQGTLDDNFQLMGNSPCLDRADGDAAPDQDIVLTSRVDLIKISNLGTGTPNYADIGAYEALMSAVPMAPIYMLLLQ